MASTMAISLAALASMESVEGFSHTVSRTTKFGAGAAGLRQHRQASTLRMASDAQDEIAQLKAMAAKAREDAARLAKVRAHIGIFVALYFRRRVAFSIFRKFFSNLSNSNFCIVPFLPKMMIRFSTVF